MERLLTAAVERAVAEAAAWSGFPLGRIGAPAMLLGLLTESECRAAMLLARHGVDRDAICRRWPELRRQDLGAPPGSLPPSQANAGEHLCGGRRFTRELESSWRAAIARLVDCPQPIVFGTEHVLLGLLVADHEVSVWLRQQGMDLENLDAEIHRQYGCHLREAGDPEAEPLEMPSEEPHADLPTEALPARSIEIRSAAALLPTTPDPPVRSPLLPSERIGVLRILDAAANRAREGLRVVEDYVRFVLDDRHLTEQFKCLRHELVAVLSKIPPGQRLAARETEADVGTRLSTPSELCRGNTADVLAANLTRLQESLRSLEEFGKVLDPALASEIERLRYRTYTLQRAAETTRTSLERLRSAQLYVLLNGRGSIAEFAALAELLIGAGVHVLQLRDKRLDDRQLIERARLLRHFTRGSSTLFIMNDRPDLAVLSEADGVHVGQEELSVKDARTIVGAEALVGVSAHSLDQAQQAVLDGANYLGVGPTFPSPTKCFDRFPGLPLLRAVAAEIRLPAFAIGGVNHENLGEVLATGFRRVAVSGAILGAVDPPAAAVGLLAQLGQMDGQGR